MQEDQEQAYDEIVLERFEWKDGSWVEFVALDTLSRADIKRLRMAFSGSKNEGEAGHNGLDEALAILISNWHIETKPDLVAPRHTRPYNPAKSLDYIPAFLGKALEEHIEPVLKALQPKKSRDGDINEPGSPTRPASE